MKAHSLTPPSLRIISACLTAGALLLLNACGSSSHSSAPAATGPQIFAIGTTMVNVYTAPSSGAGGSATATYSGLKDVHRAAFDANGNLYVTDSKSGGVAAFPEASYGTGGTGGATPSLTITGSTFPIPFGIAFDSKGYMYIANDATAITILAPITFPSTTGNNAAPTPYATIAGAATTLSSPNGMALDSANNVYVADEGSSKVLIFAASDIAAAYTAAGTANPALNIAPSTTISGFTGVHALALDTAGNLYVTDYGKVQVDIFTAAQAATGQGSVTPTPAAYIPAGTAANSVTTLGYPNGIATDSKRNIYVVDVDHYKVLIFAAVTLGTTTGVEVNVAPMASISAPSTETLHGVSVR